MPFFDKYPYTNFHNVNLDWILEKVKEWGELVEQNNTNFENLLQANEDFKAYVNTYLENLDVQAQIDDKLDRMFESGELTEYLQPYVSNAVSTWLDENITEPVGVVIDNSLTVAGAAADAKVAGDNIRNNKSIIDGLSYNTDMMLTKLQELLETVDATRGVFIAGYNSNNSAVTNPAAMPYVYVDYVSVSDFTVDSIYLNVEQTGRLSIGKVLKSDIHFDEVVDRSKYIYLDTVEVTNLGVQTVTISTVKPFYTITVLT